MNLASLGDIRNCLLGGAFAAIASSSGHNRKTFFISRNYTEKLRVTEKLPSQSFVCTFCIICRNLSEFTRKTGGKEMP